MISQIPLWSWAVANGGRKLIGEEPAPDGKCVMDRFGRSLNIVCLDGRFGDNYFAANPETLRLCVASAPKYHIDNHHSNMDEIDQRRQNLEFIHVLRPTKSSELITETPFPLRMFSLGGWAVLMALAATAITCHCWMAVLYLAVVPATGMAVYRTRGGPRKLRMLNPPKQDERTYMRVVVTANHMNETDWRVFYGESIVVNRLLNWPLKTEAHPNADHWLLRPFLRAMIISQWVLVVLASAGGAWDAYLVSAWIAFSVLSNSWGFKPEILTADWMRRHAGIRMERYCTQLSSRRALLNTLIALNPDSFPTDADGGKIDTSRISESAFAWIDPILKKGEARTQWEEDSRCALAEALDEQAHRPSVVPGGSWVHSRNGKSRTEKDGEHLHKYIHEGIQMARLILESASIDHSSGYYNFQPSPSVPYPVQRATGRQSYGTI
ncbi:unnamed protein product [Penicillium bialowiezense]